MNNYLNFNIIIENKEKGPVIVENNNTGLIFKYTSIDPLTIDFLQKSLINFLSPHFLD